MTEIKQFAKAFIAAQKEMGNATKDSKNPFFKSKYADLNSVREACLPALNDNGIAVMQPIVQVDGKNFVKTLLLHESGESIESLTEIIFNKPNDAQAQGSGITYARRYGLQSLVNIGAEDDDGNKASAGKPTSIIKKLGASVEAETTEVFAKKNEDQFLDVKMVITNCGSVEELEASWNSKSKEINSLKKRAPDLYAEICKIGGEEKAKINDE